jgi:hypothetical protein
MLHDGMPPVLDHDVARIVDRGHHVIPARGHLGKGAQHVELGNGVGGPLHPADLPPRLFPDLAEKLILESHDFILGAQHQLLELLELLGEYISRSWRGSVF